ncbi:MAG: YihA family ribosome biogenesis GTP-binding protein [Desulfovibrio sp.]|nr:YihA family ribosome biogenesis GTP-binding protein [Desulfovibrio sp.]
MPPNLVLEATAYTLSQLTAQHKTQIAIAGRSNVGKSSLINALAQRKNMALVSSTPGKTRSVNFYRVEPHGFYLVDLPGYGYARTSQNERDKWAQLLTHYLTECTGLKALTLLLDCRLPPQQLDKNMVTFALAHGISILPVLTKADKCKQGLRAARQKEWQMLLGTCPIVTSASHRLGMDALWSALLDIVGISTSFV